MTETFLLNLMNFSLEQVPSESPENYTPEPGICQIYTGKVCERYMANQSVFIPPETTMEMIEGKLAAAAGVIKNSPDISKVKKRKKVYPGNEIS